MQTLKFALLFAAVANLTLALPGQAVEPAPIPESWSAAQRQELGSARAALAERAHRLALAIAAFNEKYASIPEDPPLVATAEKEAAALEKEKKDLTAEILKFNAWVAQEAKVQAEAGAVPRSTAETQAALAGRRQQEAQRRWLGALRTPEFQPEWQEARDQFAKGYTREAELKANAMLERARTEAVADTRRDIRRWKEFQAMLARGHEAMLADPVMRKAWEESEAFLQSVEKEVDARMRTQLIAPDDSDLELLFGPGPSVRVWPGPRNPDAPLPNPLQEEAKREKVRQLVIWERRELERIEALFERPDVKEAVFQALQEELRQQ